MREELLQDLKESMREKDELRKNTIVLLRAAILQVEKDDQKELSKEEMQTIVAKEVKKRKEAIPDYENAEREDIVNQLNKEIEILSKYLAKQLSKEEIEILVKNSINKLGVKTPREMGLVMKDIKDDITGKADGKMVSEIVKNQLDNLSK
jgi:hypothetical protein